MLLPRTRPTLRVLAVFVVELLVGPLEVRVILRGAGLKQPLELLVAGRGEVLEVVHSSSPSQVPS